MPKQKLGSWRHFRESSCRSWPAATLNEKPSFASSETKDFLAESKDYDVVVGQQMVEDYELSHYVEISSVTAATKTAIHEYMAAKWAGTTSYVAGTHASFFAELDIVTR